MPLTKITYPTVSRRDIWNVAGDLGVFFMPPEGEKGETAFGSNSFSVFEECADICEIIEGVLFWREIPEERRRKGIQIWNVVEHFPCRESLPDDKRDLVFVIPLFYYDPMDRSSMSLDRDEMCFETYTIITPEKYENKVKGKESVRQALEIPFVMDDYEDFITEDGFIDLSKTTGK
jgi:hypothetical protein